MTIIITIIINKKYSLNFPQNYPQKYTKQSNLIISLAMAYHIEVIKQEN